MDLAIAAPTSSVTASINVISFTFYLPLNTLISEIQYISQANMSKESICHPLIKERQLCWLVENKVEVRANLKDFCLHFVTNFIFFRSRCHGKSLTATCLIATTFSVCHYSFNVTY